MRNKFVYVAIEDLKERLGWDGWKLTWVGWLELLLIAPYLWLTTESKRKLNR